MVDGWKRWGCGFAFAVAACCGGCASDEAPIVDFAEIARRQVLRSETSVEFQADELPLGLFGEGWAAPEMTSEGLTFAWAVGRKAALALPVLGDEKRWLHLRCRPFMWPGAAEQTIRVRINGERLGDLRLGPGFRPYTLEVPDDVLRLGDNLVELTFARADRPSERLPEAQDSRLLAVAFDYLVLSTEPRFSPPDPGAIASVTLDEGDIVQPVRTELKFPVTVPEEGRIRFGWSSADPSSSGAPAGRILVRRPGSEDVEVFRNTTDDDAVGDRRIPLTEFVGERIELVFQVLGGSDSGAMRWQRPGLLGIAPELDLTTNVVWIVVDTLRADALSCYGGPVPTPNLDRLAASGVRFARAYAHAPMTGPSHSSMFTSLLPTEHGVRNNVQVLNDRHVTLAELLRDAHRRTAAFVSLGVLNESFGLAQGFETYGEVVGRDWWRTADAVNAQVLPWLAENGDEPFFLWAHYSDPHEPYTPPGISYPNLRLVGPNGSTGKMQIDAATHVLPIEVPAGTHALRIAAGTPAPVRKLLLRGVRTGDASLSIACGGGCAMTTRDNGRPEYTVDLPATLTLTNPNDEAIATELVLRAQERRTQAESRERYLQEVAYVDSEVGRLLDALERLDDDRETLIVFTSDHGEGLGDHGLLGHVHQLYETLVHVPLIVVPPGGAFAGSVVEAPVGHVDLLPTIVEWLGLPDPVFRSGTSLLGQLQGDDGDRTLFSETWRPESTHDRQSAVNATHKLIRTADPPRTEFYDLLTDPGETNDLGVNHEAARRLLRMLDARMEDATLRSVIAEEGELSEEDLERLRALGYVR